MKKQFYTIIPDPTVNYDSLAYGKYYTPRDVGEKIRDPNTHYSLKKVYNPVDPILHRTESNTDIPAAILSVTNYLKENGVYHHIANKSKIELIRDQNKYTNEGVAFTDGGIHLTMMEALKVSF